MPKYKVGDVAALFPKPSAPKSDTGKKIQSMFDDFYKNSKKQNKPNHAQFEHKKMQVNNKETISESPKEAKKKKRKFRDNDDNESTAQDVLESQTKQKRAKFDSAQQNSNGRTTQEENYFPRNKKKSKQFQSPEENSAAFSKMNFDDGEGDSSLQFDSEVKKRSEKKKNNKSFETELFQNDNHEKFKNKSLKKIKTFANSRNQSEEFNVTDTSAFDESMEEKKSEKKKKKHKKNKIDAVVQETHMDTGDIQNDDEEHKIKKKSKKMKLFSAENSLNEVSDTEQNLEEKDEPLKVSKGQKQKKPKESAERLSRTLFIGNLPLKMTRHDLQKLFVPFGSIETCRLRGTVPVKATIPKKVAAIKSEYHAGQKSLIGYVVFKAAKDATEALSLNGTLFHNHHIVVNPASTVGEKKTYEEKRSIFIGNLPFDVEDEAIWSAFAVCGDVEAVRAIRDPESGAGKGFGYVLFKNIDSKRAALKMEGIEISGRKIRVKEINSNNRKPAASSSNQLNVMRRKARILKNTKQDGVNSRKSLKKLMNREKRNYQKKKIVNIFKKFSI